MEKTTCKNCGKEFEGNFCSYCGQKKINRHDTRELMDYLGDAFELKRGFFITFITLIKQPSKLVKEYLEGKTKIYQNPVTYLFTIISLLIITDIIFSYFDDENPDPNFLLYLIILPLVISTAISIRFIYPKSGLNVIERLLFSFYYISSFTLFLVFIEFTSLLFSTKFVNTIDLILFGTWIIGISIQYFRPFFVNYNYKTVRSILTGIASFLISFIFILLIIGLLGILGILDDTIW